MYLSGRFHNLCTKIRMRKMMMSKEYKERLLELKGKYCGKRCFIIGNGPSLTPQDLDKIKNEYSFAANKIYHIFPKTQWRPTFFCASDNGIIAECIDEINALKVERRFLSMNHLAAYRKPKTYYNNDTVLFREYPPVDYYHEPGFSDDAVKGIIGGFTVTYIEIQLAVYMGFTEIYLIGVDHGLPKGVHDTGIQNHFYSDDIRDKAVLDFEICTASYQKAREYADSHGIKIYNATRGGNLEAFERVNIDALDL